MICVISCEVNEEETPLCASPGKSSASSAAGMEGVGISLGAESHTFALFSTVEQNEPDNSPVLQSKDMDLERCHMSLCCTISVDMMFLSGISLRTGALVVHQILQRTYTCANCFSTRSGVCNKATTAWF